MASHLRGQKKDGALGEALKIVRSDRGDMSQDQAAADIRTIMGTPADENRNPSQTLYCNWETGKYAPGSQYWDALATFMGITRGQVQDLIYLTKQEQKAALQQRKAAGLLKKNN